MIENTPTNAGGTRDVGSIPGLGRFPWRRKWQPTPVFVLGQFHGQGAWWGHRESNTPEPIYINVPSGREAGKSHEIHCYVKYKRILPYYMYIF